MVLLALAYDAGLRWTDQLGHVRKVLKRHCCAGLLLLPLLLLLLPLLLLLLLLHPQRRVSTSAGVTRNRRTLMPVRAGAAG